jgi:hypothetical protein
MRTVFRSNALRPPIETRTATPRLALRPAASALRVRGGSVRRTALRPALGSVRVTARKRAAVPRVRAIAVNRARDAAWQTSCTWTLPPRPR